MNCSRISFQPMFFNNTEIGLRHIRLDLHARSLFNLSANKNNLWKRGKENGVIEDIEISEDIQPGREEERRREKERKKERERERPRARQRDQERDRERMFERKREVKRYIPLTKKKWVTTRFCESVT